MGTTLRQRDLHHARRPQRLPVAREEVLGDRNRVGLASLEWAFQLDAPPAHAHGEGLDPGKDGDFGGGLARVQGPAEVELNATVVALLRDLSVLPGEREVAGHLQQPLSACGWVAGSTTQVNERVVELDLDVGDVVRRPGKLEAVREGLRVSARAGGLLRQGQRQGLVTTGPADFHRLQPLRCVELCIQPKLCGDGRVCHVARANAACPQRRSGPSGLKVRRHRLSQGPLQCVGWLHSHRPACAEGLLQKERQAVLPLPGPGAVERGLDAEGSLENRSTVWPTLVRIHAGESPEPDGQSICAFDLLGRERGAERDSSRPGSGAVGGLGQAT